MGEIQDNMKTRLPSLVNSSLIDKARESHNSSAVTKRAERIWKQHFVSCALCKKSFSKHRASDASFCQECKCYVCHNCNCKVYHLDYQEELWAETEKTEQKKSSKRNKNKKKKEKAKQKKAKQEMNLVTFSEGVKEGRTATAQEGGKSAIGDQSRSTVLSELVDKQLKASDVCLR